MLVYSNSTSSDHVDFQFKPINGFVESPFVIKSEGKNFLVINIKFMEVYYSVIGPIVC